MLEEFWDKGGIPKWGNFSFIALIPKKDKPQGLEEFRPISLIGCVYKVISTVSYFFIMFI